MKILFITYASATGRGGHVHSMLQISDFISEFNDVKIMNLGDDDSCVLKMSKNFIGSCKVNDLKFIFSLNRQFKTKLNGFSPDIIHCFDEYSFFLASHCCCFHKQKFIFTKCGGPSSPHSYWFYADNIILFSNENFNWYRTKKQYSESNIQLIPNRVFGVLPCDLSSFGLKKDPQTFNFVRIGRIGKNYIETIQSLLDLVYNLKTVHNINRDIKIYIIGIVENDTIFREIEHHATNLKLNVEFITDERTVQASKLLGIADCVLGTGRGLMEAMSLGIPVLTPASNNIFPVLVSKSNFNSLLESNFSPRNYIKDLNKSFELDEIAAIVKDYKKYQSTKEDTIEMFKMHLSLESALHTYTQFYEKSLKKKRKYYIFNSVYLLKYLYHFLWT